jgi:hypothetical protein
MKKTLLILAGIGLLCFLLIGRLFMKQRSGFGEEREWFAKAVRYEFSAQVESVELYNENAGKLWCRLTSGNPQIHREDSLKPFFKEHDMLYLIFQQEGDSILFIAPNAGQVAAGDSVRVSSEKNSIEFFRDGKQVATDQLSNTLTGFGRPFFLKRKE